MAKHIKLCALSLFGFIVAFSGCVTPPQPQIMDLYVDAVVLQETKPKEAVEKLNQAVRINDKFFLAWSLMGDIYKSVKEYESAVSAYDRATELNPWSFKDYFELGRTYQLMENFIMAVKAYGRALEINPDDYKANLYNAQSYFAINDYQNALEYGQKAARLDPNETEALVLVGEIYDETKDYHKAIAAYKRAIENDSTNTKVMTHLAAAYLKTDRVEPAVELLDEVRQRVPANNRAFQYLGYANLMLYGRAVKEYNQTAEQGQDVSLLQEQMSEYLDKAITNYHQSLRIDQNDWEAHRGLGVAYVLMNKKVGGMLGRSYKKKAVEHWRTSLDIKPEQPNRTGLLKLIDKYSAD
ncbi:MAG: tetratricopeptide repeat protein [Phycisphaerae bacterium]|nr:tetratricopeptide repeat protein [Phycisphaerae bacterium]